MSEIEDLIDLKLAKIGQKRTLEQHKYDEKSGVLLQDFKTDPEIEKILNLGLVKVDEVDGGTLGKDLQEITKEFVKDNNAFRFGNTDKVGLADFSLLQAIADKPFYNPDVKPRYEFIRWFLFHYTINRSAIKSGQAERFKELAGSLLGFKAMLEYRSAGLMPNQADQEKKHSLLDKLKKG